MLQTIEIKDCKIIHASDPNYRIIKITVSKDGMHTDIRLAARDNRRELLAFATHIWINDAAVNVVYHQQPWVVGKKRGIINYLDSIERTN